MLTSRPTATIFLHDKVDRRVEILGFAQEERDKYISESLDSLEQGRQLQDYLKCQPIINSYVPLQLAILVYLFRVQSKLPETLTEMVKSSILHIIYRSMIKNELTPASIVTDVDSLEDLPRPFSDILSKLSKLALIGLQNNQLVFTYAEIKANCPEIESSNIPEALNGFGLLRVIQHFRKRGAGATVSFKFLYFTMQEYLAALHVSSITHKQQLSLMRKTFWNNTYNLMWMMYVGINGINSQTCMQFLYKSQAGADIMGLTLSSNIISDKLKCLHLFRCFMEAKSKEVPKEINFIFKNEIKFHGLQLLPYHISSLVIRIYFQVFHTATIFRF